MSLLVSIVLGWIFFVINFLSILSDLPLIRETDPQNVLSNFAKLKFLIGKIDWNTNFVKLPSAKWLFFYNCKFHHSRIEVLQNCSAFFVSVSLVRGKSERIERKLETEKSSHNFHTIFTSVFSIIVIQVKAIFIWVFSTTLLVKISMPKLDGISVDVRARSQNLLNFIQLFWKFPKRYVTCNIIQSLFIIMWSIV